MLATNSKWIWALGEQRKDSYVSFKDKFNFSGEKNVELKICAETNYVAYLNGKLVGYGQFAGYPNYKYVDTLSLNNECVNGENTLLITVWYEGLNSFTHIDDDAGLIYNVVADGKVIALSDKNTLSGYDNGYVEGRKHILTYQVGYTSKMVADATTSYDKSQEVVKSRNFFSRPVKKLIEEDFLNAKEIKPFNYDLGKETAGYLSVEFECEQDCTVTVAYGEHMNGGKVKRIIPGGYKNAGRDFSLEFVCKKGINSFTQYFVRLAGRYLEVTCDKQVKVNKIGLIPVNYPVEIKDFSIDGLDGQIYKTCIDTLRLCMHEHYEDCPWREQALYSLDSRNQMLMGYYTFKDTSYQRANLVFISKGKREDGFLEITYPAVDTPAIPLFSLAFIIAVGEYIDYTGDYTILDEVFETIQKIMVTFASRIDEDGVVSNFPEPFWNFYEWAEASSNDQELIDGCIRVNRHDLILNCAYVYTYKHYKKMLNHLGLKDNIDLERIKSSILNKFYDKDKNLFFLSDVGERKYSQLGNSFSVLVGLGNKEIVNKIANDKTLIEATLSMKGFVYDALLYYGKEYAKDIIDEIRKNYGYMLSQGATSFWETIDSNDLKTHPAGSLCHGWSAIPIYYYNVLKGYY